MEYSFYLKGFENPEELDELEERYVDCYPWLTTAPSAFSTITIAMPNRITKELKERFLYLENKSLHDSLKQLLEERFQSNKPVTDIEVFVTELAQLKDYKIHSTPVVVSTETPEERVKKLSGLLNYGIF